MNTTTPPTTLVDFFAGWELFRNAVYSGVLAGGLLGLVGVYVVLRRSVFLSAAISQAAGLGVAAAFYAQLQWGLPAALASPAVGSAAVTLTLVALLALASGNGARAAATPRTESILGFAFLVGGAGTLAIGTRIVEEMHDIQSLLFGSAVAVLPADFTLLCWVALSLFLVHTWLWSGFSAASFDAAGARVRGVPVRLLDGVFLATLALAISVCTRVLGVLPTFAFSVLPAMAAVPLVPNLHVALVVAALLGGASGFLGYLLAFLYELPVGASQTLVAAAAVAIAVVGRFAAVWWQRQLRRRRRPATHARPRPRVPESQMSA